MGSSSGAFDLLLELVEGSGIDGSEARNRKHFAQDRATELGLNIEFEERLGELAHELLW